MKFINSKQHQIHLGQNQMYQESQIKYNNLLNLYEKNSQNYFVSQSKIQNKNKRKFSYNKGKTFSFKYLQSNLVIQQTENQSLTNFQFNNNFGRFQKTAINDSQYNIYSYKPICERQFGSQKTNQAIQKVQKNIKVDKKRVCVQVAFQYVPKTNETLRQDNKSSQACLQKNTKIDQINLPIFEQQKENNINKNIKNLNNIKENEDISTDKYYKPAFRNIWNKQLEKWVRLDSNDDWILTNNAEQDQNCFSIQKVPASCKKSLQSKISYENPKLINEKTEQKDNIKNKEQQKLPKNILIKENQKNQTKKIIKI